MQDSRTVWCGNLSECVSEQLLYELFLQAAPLERVKIPTDRDGRQSSFAFITFKHEISVDYVVQLLNGIQLYGKALTIKPRQQNSQSSSSCSSNNKSMENRNVIINVPQMMQMNPYANDLNTLNIDRYRDFNRDSSREYRRERERERDSYKARRNENYENNRQRNSRKPYNNRNYEDRNRRYKRYS